MLEQQGWKSNSSMESHVELNSSRARTSDNLDVYKQAKQTNRQTDKHSLVARVRGTLVPCGRKPCICEEREKNLRTEKAFDSLASCFVLRVDRLLVFFALARSSTCAPRIESKSKRLRRRGAKSSKRTNERTNEYCAKRRRLKSTRPQSKSLR